MRLSSLEHGYFVAITAAFVWEVWRRREAEAKVERLLAGADSELRSFAVMAVGAGDALYGRARDLGLVGVNGRGSSA